MSSQSFLWLNLGIAFVVAAFFILGRTKIRAPSRLRLKNRNNFPGSKNLSFVISEDIHRVSGDGFETKSLNVIFIYNGHSWDAHEVLGVPAGSRQDDVTLAFLSCKEKCSPESQEFLETAYQAILHSFRKR